MFVFVSLCVYLNLCVCMYDLCMSADSYRPWNVCQFKKVIFRSPFFYYTVGSEDQTGYSAYMSRAFTC